MVKLLPLLCVVTGTQALSLAVWAPGVSEQDPCIVARGNNKEEAMNNAIYKKKGSSRLFDHHGCEQLKYVKADQHDGYWPDKGYINYVDKNTHWWCQVTNSRDPNMAIGACEAGVGTPRDF